MENEFEVYVDIPSNFVAVLDLLTGDTFFLKVALTGTYIMVDNPEEFEAEIYYENNQWILINTRTAEETVVKFSAM